MVDDDNVNALQEILNDRFTPEELCEILGLTVDDLFDKFTDKILNTDWEEVL